MECAIVAPVSYFTSRNLTLLALAQIVVLVAAILGASVAHKWHTTLRVAGEAWSTGLLMSYGWLGLAIPVAWLALTLWVLHHRRATDEVKVAAVLVGLLLLVIFLAAAWYGAASPLLGMMGIGGLS